MTDAASAALNSAELIFEEENNGAGMPIVWYVRNYNTRGTVSKPLQYSGELPSLLSLLPTSKSARDKQYIDRAKSDEKNRRSDEPHSHRVMRSAQSTRRSRSTPVQLKSTRQKANIANINSHYRLRANFSTAAIPRWTRSSPMAAAVKARDTCEFFASNACVHSSTSLCLASFALGWCCSVWSTQNRWELCCSINQLACNPKPNFFRIVVVVWSFCFECRYFCLSALCICGITVMQ